MTYSEMADLVRELGHTSPILESTRGGRWFGTCSCGYKSTTKATYEDAVGSLIHHMKKVAKEHLRNGVNSPRVATTSGSSQRKEFAHQ